MGRKEQNQFQLDNKENCCIYLLRIITTAEKCLMRLKKYNLQTKEIMDEYTAKNSVTVPYDIYGEFTDKTSNVISYLLNVIGDAQGVSISYFKYRQQVKKLMNRQVEGIRILEFTDELNELISEFNKMRNWQNHIPESLLISEEALVKQGKAYEQPRNPIEIYLYYDVSFEYFKDLYDNNIGFYEAARKLVQAAKRDYGCLIGERVTVQRKYLDTPIGIAQLDAAKMSAQVQGIKGCIEKK